MLCRLVRDLNVCQVLDGGQTLLQGRAQEGA